MSIEAFDLIVGTPVHSADGNEVGSVKEVLDRYFKLDVHMAPDYWLPVSIVRSAHQSAVVLGVNEDALGGYEVSQDDVDAARDGGGTDGGDVRDAMAAEPMGIGSDVPPVVDADELSDEEYTDRDAAVEAAAMVWGPDEWVVVRSRILEAEPHHEEAELNRMYDEEPEGLRARFAHLLDDADRSAEELARTVEENT